MVGTDFNSISELICLPCPSVNNVKGDINCYVRDKFGFYRPLKIIARPSFYTFLAKDFTEKHIKFSIGNIKPIIFS